MRRLVVVGLAVLLLALPVQAQQVTNFPSQLNPSNSQTTAVAGTATKTLTGVANRSWRIHSLSAFCSAGSATVTLTEAGTTKWSSSSGWVGTTIVGAAWTPGTYTAAPGATVVIALSTCGGGNTGTLNVVADIH